MSHYISFVLLAFTLSLDSCNVGVTYGLRKVKIPFSSISIISMCSAIVMFLSMMIGRIVQSVFSPVLAREIGGVVLIAIGAWVLYQFFADNKKEEPVEQKVWKFEIQSLGIVVQILRTPTVADVDHSGTISGMEALLLGAALSLDSFGAGIGASLLGYSSGMMALLVGAMSFLFLSVGLRIGVWFSSISWIQKLTFLPGIILIVMGVWKM